MTNTTFQPSSRYAPIDLPDFDQTYVSRKTVEAHMLRAQAASELIGGVSSFIAKLFSAPVNWLFKKTERQSLRDELNSFSDRELSDIGLSRSDIEDIVAGTYVSRRTDFDTSNVKVLKQPKTDGTLKQQEKTSIAA